MFEVPIDAWYVWLGLATASLAVFGVVGALPATAPPDAGPVADGVDEVAASPYEGTTEVAVRAEELRLRSTGLSLRTGEATSHATFAYGPVTPAREGDLAAVLAGSEPAERYRSPADFARAARQARKASASWQTAPESLTVRRVTWRGVSVTLVG